MKWKNKKKAKYNKNKRKKKTKKDNLVKENLKKKVKGTVLEQQEINDEIKLRSRKECNKKMYTVFKEAVCCVHKFYCMQKIKDIHDFKMVKERKDEKP